MCVITDTDIKLRVSYMTLTIQSHNGDLKLLLEIQMFQ